MLKLVLLRLLFGRVANLFSPKKTVLFRKMPDSDLKTYTHKTCIQGRNEVRWLPGQEVSLALPCSNLRFFRSSCTVSKKVLVCDIVGTFRRPGIVSPLPPLRPASS